jgi:hypothetical protein
VPVAVGISFLMGLIITIAEPDLNIRNGNIDKCMQMMHLWIHEDPRRFEGVSNCVN